MGTTVRDLLRDFAGIRQRADAGETVRIRSRKGNYIFKADNRGRRGLVGSCANLAPEKGSAPGPVESPGAWAANR